MTGDPDAPASDEPPSSIDWRRPGGPSETAVRAGPRRPPSNANVEPSSRFEVARVLQRTFDIVRARWLELFLVTFVLVWGAPRLIWLVVQSNYRVWSQALTPLGLNAAARLSVGLTYDLGLAMVMTTALRGRDKTTLSGLSQLLRALPALIPAWLVSETNTAWSLWVSWSGWFRRGSLPIGEVLEIQLAVFGLELLLVLAATVGIGVLYPVVLQEGRSLPGGVSRAWGLMHGARWRFASLFLIYLAMISVISLPDTWVVIVRAGADVRGVAKWITGGFSDAADALWCVVVVASYMELRSIGDGASELEVAQAFT